MAKCVYKECQFKENYTSMPASVRALYIIISFLLTTLHYKSSLSFTTIAVLYIPLMNEYRCLSKIGRDSKMGKIHKMEYWGSCGMLLIALLGVTTILQMDVSSDMSRIYINMDFPYIGGYGVDILKFWMFAAVLTIVSAVVDWQVTPNSKAREISEFVEVEKVGAT